MIPFDYNLLGSLKKCLTLTAKAANSTVKLTATGSPTISGLQYRRSVFSNWSQYTIDTVITLENIGDYVQFQNNENTLSLSLNDYVKFVMTGDIDASGNVQSMLNYSNSVPTASFYRLFRDCTVLHSAPVLPSKILSGNHVYREMFFNTRISIPPVLPATILSDWSCYYGMFMYCSSLLFSPELPALDLSNSCYTEMFAYCTSLERAGRIHGKTYGYSSCMAMFTGCTSLVQAPELEWTTYKSGTDNYMYMFNNCTSLNSIRVNFTRWPNTSNTGWMNNVSSTGTFYKPSTLPEERGADRIPTGWTVINI